MKPVLFGLFILIVIYAAISEDEYEREKEKEEPVQEVQQEKDRTEQSLVVCKRLVEDKLQHSADFPTFNFNTMRDDSGERYGVRSRVDTQNRHGADVTLDWSCVVSYQGEPDSDWRELPNWKVDDLRVW